MNRNCIFFIHLFACTLLYCGCKSSQGHLMSVNGKISAKELGTTLIHEHVLVDWIGADSTSYDRWDRDQIVERALPYLLEAKQNGVQSFFDCTPAYLGRDAFILNILSERSGLHIITNTGYYGARQNKYMPDFAFTESADILAKRWIDEYKNGIDGSGIHPGFIKISVDPDEVLSQQHEKIVRALARCHKATGLTIVSHTGPDGPAFAQIKILVSEGISPEAFVWTHAQNGSPDGYIKAAQEGAWISLDHVSSQDKRLKWYVETLQEAKAAGILSKILISHDSGWYNVGQPNGGDYKDYNAIFTHLIPLLKSEGFSQRDVDQLLVENPKKAYAIQRRLKQ